MSSASPQRIVQRPDDRGDRDRDPTGGAEDRPGMDEGCAPTPSPDTRKLLATKATSAAMISWRRP